MPTDRATVSAAPRRQSGANQRRSIRMPYAIGDVGMDVSKAAEAVHHRIHEKGPHLVLVAPSGSVYVVLAYEVKAEILAEDFPAWVAGWFSAAASVDDLAVDLIETWRLQRVAA